MKRSWLITIGLLIVLLWLLAVWLPKDKQSLSTVSPDPDAHSIAPLSVATNPLPGDVLLESYGNTNTTIRTDLRQILRVFDNALVLVKQSDTRHYTTNEDLADFLRGKNWNQTSFVSPGSKIFGADGRILDRWGNPLHVHPVSTGKIELRSAAPDGIAWTADDVLVDSPM